VCRSVSGGQRCTRCTSILNAPTPPGLTLFDRRQDMTYQPAGSLDAQFKFPVFNCTELSAKSSPFQTKALPTHQRRPFGGADSAQVKFRPNRSYPSTPPTYIIFHYRVMFYLTWGRVSLLARTVIKQCRHKSPLRFKLRLNCNNTATTLKMITHPTQLASHIQSFPLANKAHKQRASIRNVTVLISIS